MNHSFELKTGKKIELTSEEFSEFVALIQDLLGTIPGRIIWQSIPYPMQITQLPDPYPDHFRRIEITCGSV